MLTGIAAIDFSSEAAASEGEDFDLNVTSKKIVTFSESEEEADFDLNETSKRAKNPISDDEIDEVKPKQKQKNNYLQSLELSDEDETQRSQPVAKEKQPKKPKESLKAILKEAGALIRETAVIELPVAVAKPKNLSFILNEALATAAQSTEQGRQAQKALNEEKRRAQQTRLHRLLGPERLAQLSREKPKIGAVGLNEEFMVAPGESLKLVNLPDARGNSTSSTPRKKGGFAAHLPRHTPTSIDLLNEKLAEKIAAQSTKAAARISAQIAQEAAKARAVAAAAEKKRQLQLAEKERKLELKRQEVTAGPKFQQAGEKPVKVVKKPLQATLQPMRPRIILSDDSGSEREQAEDEDEEDEKLPLREEDPEFVDYDADLAEEGFVVDEAEASDAEEESQQESEAEFSQEEDSIDALLSGKFTGAPSAPTTLSKPIEPLKVEIVKAKPRSNFVDDEAEDEDEELEAEMIDEEELERELRESKFIAEDEQEDEGDIDARAVHQQLKFKEDMHELDRLANKYAKKLPEEAFLDHLGRKYGDYDDDEEAEDEEFNDHSSQLNIPDAEQRKRMKLAAVEQFNPAYLRRAGTVRMATKEFLFPEEIKAAERQQRAYFDSTHLHLHHTAQPSSHPSSDFYSSATESEADFEDDLREQVEEDEKAMYEEEGHVDELPAEIDLENDQVEASESLNSAMKSMNEISFDFSSFSNTTLAKNILMPTNKQASAMVPKAKDLMKAKLAAMQQTEEGTSNSSGAKVFKGFTAK